MAAGPQFINKIKNWHAALSAANTNRDGTGTIVDLIDNSSGECAVRCEKVRLVATAATTAGVIRFFLHNGTAYKLFKEVLVTAITPSASIAVWDSEETLELNLQKGWKLAVSTHNAETFNALAEGGEF